MPKAELPSLESLNARVAQIPLLSPDGMELKYAQLDPYDQWAVSTSRTFFEALLSCYKDGWESRTFHASLADNLLESVLRIKGYHYCQNIDEVKDGREVALWQQWHAWALDYAFGWYKPTLQIVKVEGLRGYPEGGRRVTTLSYRWELDGLTYSGGRERWAVKQKKTEGMVEALLKSNLKFKMTRPAPNEGLIVEPDYYGFLAQNI